MTDQPKSLFDGIKPYNPEPTGEEIDFAYDMVSEVLYDLRDSFQKRIRTIRQSTEYPEERRQAVEWQFCQTFQEKVGISAYSPWINQGL